MALQLSLENDSGFTSDYWRIKSVKLDYSVPECLVELELYKDAAARSAGKSPTLVKQYYWTGGDFTGWFDAATLDIVSQNPQERAYVKLKSLPEFTGAVDV